MRKIIFATLLLSVVACTNPEDGASGATADSTLPGNNSTLNTPPGGTTADTSGGATMDTSHP